MDPTTVVCPHVACPARGQAGQGNIRLHARQDQRFLCPECHTTFTTTTGTAVYRLRTAAETVTLVVTLRAHGCPLPASVVACGCDARTVAAWGARAGRQGQAVQAHLVEHPRDLGPVQADEIRVKTQGGIVWMALARMVKTRLWWAGEGSEPRDMTLIRQRIERVRRCAAYRPLLWGTEGVSASVRAMRETFRAPVRTGAPGRPRLRPWRHSYIAQVVKRYVPGRLVDVERRIVEGTPARGETLRRRSQGHGVINPADIERLKATFREPVAALTRRGRALVRHTLTLRHGMYLIGSVSNFWTYHASLRLAASAAGMRGIKRTPAMAAGTSARRCRRGAPRPSATPHRREAGAAWSGGDRARGPGSSRWRPRGGRGTARSWNPLAGAP